MMITDDPKLAAGAIGIEIVTPALVAQLRANIDPQHGCHKPLAGWDSSLQMSAVGYVASKMPIMGFFADGHDENELVFFIEKPDLDSIAAVALLAIRMDTKFPQDTSYHLGVRGIMQRVRLIDELDCGLSGDVAWKPGSEFVDAGSHPELRGLARVIADRGMPLEERVGIMQRWLISGTHSLIEAASKEAAAEMEDGRSHAFVTTLTIGAGGSVETQADQPGHLAIVELDNEGKLSRGRGACAIGYQTAPVVIAVCEDFAGRDWTGRKYTVAVHPGAAKAGFRFDFERFLRQIAGVEAGWGGNTKGPGGIVGSPMNGPSMLPLRFVKQAAIASLAIEAPRAAEKEQPADEALVRSDDPYHDLLTHGNWRDALVNLRGEYPPGSDNYAYWDHEIAALDRLIVFHQEQVGISDEKRIAELVELLRSQKLADHPTISEQWAKLIVGRYRLVPRTSL